MNLLGQVASQSANQYGCCPRTPKTSAESHDCSMFCPHRLSYGLHSNDNWKKNCVLKIRLGWALVLEGFPAGDRPHSEWSLSYAALGHPGLR